ncbi:tyrosine-type recombinase/integrase [Pseudomonas sp. CCI3.2]|uniref:tyrosine-type recombinase/integrase n=1 Tax=unclassified Pseudomonas TaxID=196821 RepID=UPI002B22BAE7|nr:MULTISPECIES: tyrosine-type recombinase/integrase [unclassified Pseudomonas]MEB0076293.1 tyrosine-type recombinase/integrase [Pseudomonas sp. MH10out]MEB0101068.1 tyrosine-type recombinase/integrase [Pseudomonas sp. CCI3.2]MEB0128927.1 tyrosine-type recombinase/integrase [Pseudomonas sp. CCI2.4]
MTEVSTKFKFTKSDLAAIEKTNKRVWYRDTQTVGLAMCVTPAGSKTFYVIHRVAGMGRKGNTEFLRLGSFPDDLTVERAREAARRQLKTLNSGESVRAAVSAKKDELSVGDLWEQWKTERSVGPNPAQPIKRSWNKDQRLYDCHLKDRAKRRVSEITTTVASKIFSSVTVASGPVEANHVKRLARAMWNHAAQRHGLDAHNPWTTIKSNDERSREEWVMPAQMPALFKAIDSAADRNVADMVRLCLFTGARSGNVKAMRWDKIDLDTGIWTIGGADHKNKNINSIPLAPLAVAILRKRVGLNCEWVFPAATKSGHMIDARKSWRAIVEVFAAELELSKMPDLRIHDLRHTTASWLVTQGVSLPMVGKLLGHTSPATTAKYAHLAIDPIREVLNRTTAAMGAITDKESISHA